MPVVSGSRPLLAALALAALLSAAPMLAGCGAGGGGTGGGVVTQQPFYVASFRPGGGSPEEHKYVLTSGSEPHIRIVQVTPGTHPVPAAASPRQPGTPTASMQPPVTPPSDATGAPAPGIAWVNNGQYLAVTTYGSSSCPDGPESIRVVADQEIEVGLGGLFPDSDVCTADLGPYVTVVKLPQGVTPTKPLTAHFGKRQATLPAAGH